MKTRKFCCCILSVLFSFGISQANKIDIKNISYSGPVEVVRPVLTDTVDAKNNPYKLSSILNSAGNYSLLPKSVGDTVMVLGNEKDQIHFITFPLNNERFAPVTLKVTGAKSYKTYIDNKEVNGETKLTPGNRTVLFKILTSGGKTDTIVISALSPLSEKFNTNIPEKGRAFTLDDVIYADHFNNVKVSPSGKYALLSESKTTKDKKSDYTTRLIDLKTGKTLSIIPPNYNWLESDDLLWFIDNETNGNRTIKTLNPVTFEETVFAENIPSGRFQISPNNEYLIYFTHSSAHKENKDIYRVINPEDRQQGYRDVSGLAIYDLNTGVYQPLTFGSKNIHLQDISRDGKKLLLMESRNRFEKRPTTVFSIFELPLATMKPDTLVFEDGFISGAKYSPDATKIAISGSPESLNGIGKNVPEGRIPNMTEGELFIMDLATREISPVTKNFNPSVQNFNWQNKTGNLFFTAENKDKISLFEYNAKGGQISNLNVPEDIILNFSLADNALEGAVIGESASNPDVLYAMDFKKDGPVFRRLEGKGDKWLNEVALADVIDWDFVNSKGDTINGRFYLPPNFDSTQKYPLIVNYYGGCSPTSRNFATRYPHHVYANNGYVVYVINPSGATGFGQEFASRHVNTAGEGVAQDIIEGTQKFIEEHPYIDKEKIGCIGASYGGFMTQYLQTVTDLFAAAISHAGISDHTSYWGNGYWGYSYSEVSMADSYPWSDPDLYVKQSPLFNADKINTPILFLHGDEDTNVPPAESIQLFTALKLLGKDTALVEVSGQNHHIMDPDKRAKWQDTIFAWFAKYLQDDPTWWEELYPTTPMDN